MNASSNSLHQPDIFPVIATASLLGTPLAVIDYSGLLEQLPRLARKTQCTAIDFCNTQVVAMRCTDSAFNQATTAYDYFMPDGMPLVWCLRGMNVPIRDRVYGPSFMRYALVHENKLSHYFLGGSADTLGKLLEQARNLSHGKIRISGSSHKRIHVGGASPGHHSLSEQSAIIDEINRLSPDVIWVGLGTPKQQQWIRENKHKIQRGVLLSVGFAFDVNAGTKRDAPAWMQRFGLTWIFRISQEPRRLLGRYIKYNTIFIVLIFIALFRSALGMPSLGSARPRS